MVVLYMRCDLAAHTAQSASYSMSQAAAWTFTEPVLLDTSAESSCNVWQSAAANTLCHILCSFLIGPEIGDHRIGNLRESMV